MASIPLTDTRARNRSRQSFLIVLVLVLQIKLSAEVDLRHVHRVAHDLAPAHQEPVDEENADEGDACQNGKGDPVRPAIVVVGEIGYLDREIRCHETERQEEDTQLCKQRSVPIQPGRGLRVPLCRKVEILHGLR